ncbi:LuxR C-terminal-related transcriptional regulator [Pollutimonas harenae]|uniref:PAS domain S-box protein n=1 Tax=Pollutimonas harenae TaxID=657015 RepID=A0A853H804_9BURK|nr:LuxR C-terminal-related transcriptional regulator [Pollutimonas harenae]NYT86623.1 PAS domain S-box protein [Pollutimonas harenae]TEA69639.1 PAS domain S-box protein [Pollutimonas harenae]
MNLEKRSESPFFQAGEHAPHILHGLAFKESPAPQIITQNRRILQCNKAFAALFGFSTAELENELILRLYPNRADYHEIGDRCLKALQHTTSYEDERFMQHRNGQIFWTRARGVTLTPNQPFELMIWSFDRIRHNETKTTELTPREQEVSGFIVNGLTCKETAVALGISHRTVEVHRARVMKKLGAKNTAELVSKIVMITHTGH